MELFAIDTELFKLDGGAVFGVVPKSIWSKKMKADENNLVTLSMRLLLLRSHNRLILFDTGIGNKQDEKFFSHYHLNKANTLDKSLASLGCARDDITDVVLTHLHFDHAGGAVQRQNNTLRPAFKKAIFWSNKAQWDWAMAPNPREKASFLQENLWPLLQSGQLQFIDFKDKDHVAFVEDVTIYLAHGHTRAMMLPLIKYKNRQVFYTADLFITAHHLPIHYVASYDVAPMQSMQEKEYFLAKAIEDDYIFLFEHDATTECCTLQRTGKGIGIRETFKLSDI